MSNTSETRPLTAEEDEKLARRLHQHTYYSNINQRIEATWNSYLVYSNTGKFPWKYQSSNKDVTKQDYEDKYPKLTHLTKFNYQSLSGLYKDKNVYWAPYTSSWKYNNHKDIEFTDSEEDPESEENPQEQEEETQENPGNESDNQEEVSQLLESATQTVSADMPCTALAVYTVSFAFLTLTGQQHVIHAPSTLGACIVLAAVCSRI
jgi:hypothetical protein